MIFDFTIKTTKSPAYSADAPLETELQLKPGIIHKLDVRFRSGCASLVSLKILQGIYQIWPSNPLGMFVSDNEVISFREFFNMFDSPYKLHALTWNDDDTYDHSINLRFGILESWQLGVTQPERKPRYSIRDLQQFINTEFT